MKRTSLLFVLALLCLYSTGQNPGWTVPSRYVHFFTGNSTALPNLPMPAYLCGTNTPNQPNNIIDGYDGQLPEYASNMMLTPQGDVEFFIVDGVIYDGEGNFIDDMTASTGLITGTSEILIVPDPGNCSRYYIFASASDPFWHEKLPYVFLLDMSAQSMTVCTDCEHYGALELITCPTNGNQQFGLPLSCVHSPIVPNAGGKLSNSYYAASELQPGNFRWVFVSNGGGIFRFKIDANGINYDNHYIAFGPFEFNPFRTRSEMELVSLPGGGFRIATVYMPKNITIGGIHVWEHLFVVDLDQNGNAIAGTEKRFPMFRHFESSLDKSAAIKGIEFSENGDRIYVTHNTNAVQPNQFEYYDYSFTTTALQPFSISSSIDVQYSGLELADNDRLVIANANGLYQLPNATTAVPTDFAPMMSFNYAPNYEGIPGYDFFKMYMLPDQIDGMNYTDHFVANLACCVSNTEFDASIFEASSGEWMPNSVFNNNLNPLISGLGFDAFIQTELRIPAGVELKITNMNLKFAPGARLVIENGTSGQQGGKLTLVNTTLTVDERCSEDAMWLGVEVWGNTSESQGYLNNSTQGRLIMTSNSRIEHAQIGVLVSKRNATYTNTTNWSCDPIQTVQPFSFDNARNGGILRTTSSTFFGNQRGVYFLPYLAATGANNLSQFSRSTFEWNGLLKGGLSPQQHAYLRGVKGIRFIGCAFQNQTPNLFSTSQLGTGILSVYAQFHVQEHCSVFLPPCSICPNGIPSTFDNLRFGVRTFNPGELTFSVDRSVFNNCQYGIRAQLTKKGQITRNSFNVRQAAYQTAGIAMYTTPSFVVQENEFQGLGSNSGALSYGIVVNNSGVANNEFYKNSFANLNIAGQSESTNAEEITTTNYPGASGFVMSGLNWTCNDFRNTIETADLTVVNGRIDYFQGHAIGHPNLNAATLGSARNKFSLDGESPSLEHDVMVSGSPIQELQYVGLNSPFYTADSYSPNWVLPLVSSYNGAYATATTSMCPTQLCEKDKEKLNDARLGFIAELDGLNGQLGSLAPRDVAGRERLQSLISAKTDDLDHLETRMISDLLIESEDIAAMEPYLTAWGKTELLADLRRTYAQDLSEGLPSVDLETIENFLPIVAGRGSSKGLGEIDDNETFAVYPNPSNGLIELDLSQLEGQSMQINVVDALGRTVFQKDIAPATHVQIDLSELKSGIYILILQSDDQLVGTRKIEVKR